MSFRIVLGAAGLSLACVPAMSAQTVETGGKLMLTRGISTVEGAGGGGLAPWALITGNSTERGIGASAHYSYAALSDFDIESFGLAAGFYDRFEISYSRMTLDTRDAGAALGLGEGFEIAQDIWGAKLRVAGDAIYAQDSWMPQIAVGAQFKRSNREDLVKALGAEDHTGVDIYASATKLFLAESILANATLRYTSANQTGLLGFSGSDDASLQPEFSIGYMLSRRLIVGGEYRFKPDNLAFAQEDDFFDVFGAYAVNHNLTLTAGYADLGSIATFGGQRGVYLSAQIGF
ncbi:DUF3034 family protein [Hyphomonas sp.]|uniref:DUF3034 family protein n=1 Tax=Hyphomonas sp. TaxID=87 RepID=UPI00391A975A